MLKKNTIGVFLGRFQPFHIGHMSIVEEILQHHERRVLVIGSAEKSVTDENQWIPSYGIDISGTKIREMIKRGQDVSQWTVL